ncbi:MAG: glycosyl hydrolase 53 family protein [Spongiibacteraceae bacterium]|nr:glycosyl hydrolase 53 family protein [Spongiibacteraceae bacterium]
MNIQLYKTISIILLLFVSSYSVHTRAASFAKGADVSWLSEMKSSGYAFYDDNGNSQDVLDTLKEHGMDSIRLRVWVNPAGGWNGVNDVITKAVEAKNKGFRIMIDFHYSDSWADPGKQTKPAAWVNYSFEELMSAVYWHTYDVMTALKNAGVDPEWVQVGNETNNGMLWEDGRASENMMNFAWLVNSGYDAVKAVNSNSLVIVHISNCFDNALFRWMFDGLTSNGAKWDIIGASIYPSQTGGGDWVSQNNQCFNNLNDIATRYSRDVMIVEVGMPWDDVANSYSAIADIIAKVRAVSGGRGAGVFYWEPQSCNWRGYTLGMWDTSGKPTDALDAFLEGAGGGSGDSVARLQSRSSGRCVDVYGGGGDDGADIIQWTCHENDNQQWTFEDMGDDYFRLRVGHSGKCLDILGAGTADGDNIVQWSCHESWNQQWKKEDMGSGYFRLRSRFSDKCVDLNAGGANNGDTIIQWSCHSNYNQQWREY